MTKWIMLSVAGLTLCGCEKSRADYRDEMARAICYQKSTCGGVGPDGKFASIDDCVTEFASRYNKRWPAKKCDQTIDAAKFAECKSRAVTNACDANPLDLVSFELECGASAVCSAQPPEGAAP